MFDMGVNKLKDFRRFALPAATCDRLYVLLPLLFRNNIGGTHRSAITPDPATVPTGWANGRANVAGVGPGWWGGVWGCDRDRRGKKGAKGVIAGELKIKAYAD